MKISYIDLLGYEELNSILCLLCWLMSYWAMSSSILVWCLHRLYLFNIFHITWHSVFVYSSKFCLKRRLRIRTLQYGSASNINELYDSVDPEAMLSILVHKVIFGTSFFLWWSDILLKNFWSLSQFQVLKLLILLGEADHAKIIPEVQNLQIQYLHARVWPIGNSYFRFLPKLKLKFIENREDMTFSFDIFL